MWGRSGPTQRYIFQEFLIVVDYLKQWLCVVCPTMPSVPDNMGNQFASGICGTDAHIDEVLFLFWLEDSK